MRFLTRCGHLAIPTATVAVAVVLHCPPAAADVDLNGLWHVRTFVSQGSLSMADVCALTILQSQTTLAITGTCEGNTTPATLTGTIDPATGSFTASGSAPGCASLTIDGTAVSDSRTFAGEFSCSGPAATGGWNASRCGNGQIDAGENCDDRNLADGDCCSSFCRLGAAGATCPDDGSPCTVDTCNGTGQCQHTQRSGECNDQNSCTVDDSCVEGVCVGTPKPAGASCDDGNPCTSGDTCSGGVCTTQPVVCPDCMACNATVGCAASISNTCEQSSAHSLTLQGRSGTAVRWRFDGSRAMAPAQLADLLATASDYDFCIYDGNVDEHGTPGLLLAARAAEAGWEATAHGVTYSSRRDPTSDGLRGIALRAGSARGLQVRVKAIADEFPQLPSLAMPLTVQLKSSDQSNAQCWSAQYHQPRIQTPRALRAGLRIRPPDARPNILVVQLDDTRADGIDRMPTVGQLAAQGISFSNSFVVNPLCGPSRASLLTGLSARRHGVRQLGRGASVFRERGADRQTVAVWLQAAGYLTGLFGKYVNGYAFPRTQPLGPGGTHYVPPGWTRWRGMASPEHYGGVRGPTYEIVDEHGAITTYDAHATDGQYSTDLLAAELRSFITDAVSDERPFFAVWTPYASHIDQPTLTANPAIRHLFFFRTLAPWRPANWNEADVSDKPRWLQSFLPAAEGSPVDLYNEGVRQTAYESLLAVDEQLGLIINQLTELGIGDNTVIILTSDNGVTWGEHRLFLQSKDCPYEECVRVPMIVHDRRFQHQAVVQDAPVLNIDVAPTVAALAGIVPPVPTDGMSFAPYVTGQLPAHWRDDFLLEHWPRTDTDRFGYRGQTADGDQLRVMHGNARTTPRESVVFEFDDGGGGVAGDAVAVPIGGDADSTFTALAAAIGSAVPAVRATVNPATDVVTVLDESPNRDGVYVIVQRDQGSVIAHGNTLANYFGVRDVANGFTYVEHVSGEIELYDLTVDPAQLDNKANDPTYAGARARLAARLDEMLE